VDEEHFGRYPSEFSLQRVDEENLGRYLGNFFAKGGWIERGG
jgi:hypothetical protein